MIVLKLVKDDEFKIGVSHGCTNNFANRMHKFVYTDAASMVFKQLYTDSNDVVWKSLGLQHKKFPGNSIRFLAGSNWSDLKLQSSPLSIYINDNFMCLKILQRNQIETQLFSLQAAFVRPGTGLYKWQSRSSSRLIPELIW